MNGKINNTLIASLKAANAPYEVNDLDLKGFGLRVQPSGVKSYYVRYRIRGKQTRYMIGRTTEFTPAQARDAARTALAGINLGSDPLETRKPIKKAKTFGQFIDDDYSPWVTTHRKAAASTLARIRKNFAEHWNKPLTDVTGWIVEKWRQQRLNHPTKAAKPATVNRDLNALKAALAKAVEWELLELHPLTKVKLSKIDSDAVVRYLAPTERSDLLAALDQRERSKRAERVKGNAWRRERRYAEMPDLNAQAFVDHLKPTVIVSLNTGLRQGELLSLTWGDVDLPGQSLTVHGANAKSGKTRHVPLNSQALNALAQWRQQAPEKQQLVFPGPGGKRMVDVKSAWSRLLKDAKIENFRWHDMRHDFASRLVMAGIDLNTVRELLGHSDLKMTIRYAHLAPQHKAQAVEKMLSIQ